MLHQLDENNSSAKIILYNVTSHQYYVNYILCMSVCVFDSKKMCQPVEMDNRRALMSCCFCSVHHFGRLFPLMLIISLDLCPIDSWLL